MLYKEGSAWELPRADPFCLLPWSADPICTAVQPVPPDMAAGPCRPVDFGVVLWYTGGKETKNAAAPGSGDSRKACNGIGKYPAQQEFLHRFISITVLQCFHKGREPGLALPYGCVLERAEKGRTVEHCHTHAARVNGWRFMAVSPCSIFVSPRKGKGGAAASAPGFLPPGVTKKAVFSRLGGNGFCIAMQRSDDPWKR